MILAMSRFKVANGLEAVVADAFANRPGLVDQWPGFLGMESVHRHGRSVGVSSGHTVERPRRLSRVASQCGSSRIAPGYAAGMRLDPWYTQLIELERLPRSAALDGGVLLDASTAIATYLERTRVIHVVRCDVDGGIQFVNAAMAKHLGLAPEGVRGRSIFACLVEHDARVLRQRLGDRSAQLAPST